MLRVTEKEKECHCDDGSMPGLNFFGTMPLFCRYSGVNATNAANFLIQRLYTKKRRWMSLALKKTKKRHVQKIYNMQFFSDHDEIKSHGHSKFYRQRVAKL